MASPDGDSWNRPSGTGTGQTGGTEAAKDQADQMSGRVKDKAGDLKRQAQDAADDLRQRARSAADEQKNAAAEQMEGVARAIRTAADDLRGHGQPMVAEYSSHLAEGLESMAQSLGRRNVDDLVEGVEDFARQRPVAFLGGAVVAGFALARFMKSSAERRHRRSGETTMARASRSGAGASPAPGTTAPGPAEVGSAGTPLGGGYAGREEGAL